MIIHRYSLHQLKISGTSIINQHQQVFNARDYSIFKYGSGDIAEKFAAQMRDVLCLHAQDFLQGNISLTSSAFKYVPTASYAIAEHLYHQLNCLDCLTLEFIKISRNTLFPADYGNLTQKQRNALMQKNHLYFENQPLGSKKMIVVDDSRITGSHEDCVRRFLTKEGFEEVIFIYVLEFTGKVHPQIEHTLNHAWINSLDRLAFLIQAPDFRLNARICKFIFSYPDQHALLDFFNFCESEFLIQLEQAICGDGYQNMEMYQPNYQNLQKVLQEREVLETL
jgi:hypothetical protein